ncbi:MAG: hypothetical protein AAF754_01415 [Pseudomonadota bacterium]
MTTAGLRFLEALAAQNDEGCFLEIGPLFGSSTQAIDAGRTDSSLPIHTIDTFHPAPWVEKRFGYNLSRNEFDKHTKSIANLTVHEGFAPDLVKKTWSMPIGFYFDDATHGNPGWMNNFSFFSPYFTPNAVLCGDDFSGSWPDIVRNVHEIAELNSWHLHVIGRVWAMTPQNDDRVLNAVHTTFPKLKKFAWHVAHDAGATVKTAASWAYGLHRHEPIRAAQLNAPSGFEMQADLHFRDGQNTTHSLTSGLVNFDQVRKIRLTMPHDFRLQFCIAQQNGNTRNTKDIAPGVEFELGENECITSLRLSHVSSQT